MEGLKKIKNLTNTEAVEKLYKKGTITIERKSCKGVGGKSCIRETI